MCPIAARSCLKVLVGKGKTSAAIGVVTQDSHMFHDSIRGNLTYARPEATDEELVAACGDAQHVPEGAWV